MVWQGNPSICLSVPPSIHRHFVHHLYVRDTRGYLHTLSTCSFVTVFLSNVRSSASGVLHWPDREGPGYIQAREGPYDHLCQQGMI